ncbi:MAG TPA: N,N-dimethylformamidase beta subunit family domain-containing protein [Urbifossiella sp.]|jgi:hypothetical protein|nr:N,N-dimethylformamidase beta subunit family domain-containing protein [Urbifossiella sp.]
MPLPRPSRRAALRAGAVAPFLTAAAAQEPPARPALEGYTDQLSYAPGDTVRFHLSAAGGYQGRLVRAGGGRPVVIDLPAGECVVRPVPKDASARGCRWPVSVTYALPADLRSGYYRAEFRAATDPQRVAGECFLVVRPKRPAADAKILIQLATNTYNAYTNWGGYSLYAYHGRHKVQGRRVSFDRPQSSQFSRWEEPFVRWAEANGYALDYAVNSDLEFRPEILAGYKLVLSVGHDEYWSAPMRDNLERYIAGGGNVAFFSGNTCCWQVRSEEGGRALACWKQSFGDDPAYTSGDHARLTSLWSHYLVNRPENSLTGVGFLWGGYHRSHGQFMDGSGAYTAHRPGHWLLAGTGLNRGDPFGAKLPAYKVVGYECDGCELAWADGLPTPTGRDGTPAGFEVVATAPARWHPDDAEWYEKWEKGRTGYAVVGTFTRGGTVVTVGSTDWAFGLRGNDPAVTRITKNVLDRLGA